MSRTIFIAAHVSLGILLAYVQPFASVLLGKDFGRSVVTSWGYLILYILALCIGIPVGVHLIAPDFTNEVLRSWVPETIGIVPVVILGWLPPLISATVGYGIRLLILQFWPAALSVNSRPKQ